MCSHAQRHVNEIQCFSNTIAAVAVVHVDATAFRSVQMPARRFPKLRAGFAHPADGKIQFPPAALRLIAAAQNRVLSWPRKEERNEMDHPAPPHTETAGARFPGRLHQ